MKRILGIVFIFSFGVLLSSCGFVQNPGGRVFEADEEPSELGESEQAFSDSLFSLVRERCGDCHNEVSGQAPYFAFPNDIQKSHDNILSENLVDLSHPGLSRIVIKVRDQGHQTWTGDKEADADELQSAISSWALALEDEEVLTGSNRVTIPAMISDCSNLDVTTWTPMSFSLDGIVSGLTGAQFQLRICQQSVQTYRISDYQISAPISIEVSGIKIYVNEVFDAAPSLNHLEPYELTTLNTPVLLFPPQPDTPNTADSLSVQEGPGVDKIHLDFDLIQVISN